MKLIFKWCKKIFEFFFILNSLFISLTEILKITTRISIITNVFSQWKCSVLYFKNETQNKDHLKVLIVLVIKWSSCQNLFILISNNVNNIPFKVINLGGFKIYKYIFFSQHKTFPVTFSSARYCVQVIILLKYGVHYKKHTNTIWAQTALVGTAII